MIRKINILNKDYENVGLDASNPRLSGFSLREVFEENEIPSNISGEELSYWEKVYNYLKNGTKESGFAYVPTSRFSIDKPISKLNNNTLRDIFETKYPQINSYKLNEELYNYIDYDNLIFYENVGQIIFDGSEEWIFFTTPKNFYRFTLSNLSLNTDRYMTHTSNWLDSSSFISENTIGFSLRPDELYIQLDDSYNLTNLIDFKNYLTQNPLIITYELAEKQEIPLTEQDLEDLPKSNEELDYYFKLYEKYKNIIIYPKYFEITEPSGLGNNFKMLEVNNKIYDYEPNFENISLNVNFGLYNNAYNGYNELINLIKDNEAIIEYDYGKGTRYCNVRLLNAPKTEKDGFNRLLSKFNFKRLSYWYEIIEIEENNTAFLETQPITNELNEPLPIIIETQSTTALNYTIDIIGVGKIIVNDTTNLYINAETKEMLDNGNSAYEKADKNNKTFLHMPKGTYSVSLSASGAASSLKIIVKKWLLS